MVGTTHIHDPFAFADDIDVAAFGGGVGGSVDLDDTTCAAIDALTTASKVDPAPDRVDRHFARRIAILRIRAISS